MLPAAGRLRPMIVRSSTDLPVPEPPTTPITSPRRDVEVEVVVHDLPPEPGHAGRAPG